MQKKQFQREKIAFNLKIKTKLIAVYEVIKKNSAFYNALVKKIIAPLKNAVDRNNAFVNFHIIYEEKRSSDKLNIYAEKIISRVENHIPF